VNTLVGVVSGAPIALALLDPIASRMAVAGDHA